MNILHLSDTHGRHHELGELPAADVLVHSGDFTLGGSDMEALDFIEWLCNLPYSHKIFIAGNHDDCMLDATLEGLPDNVHYLTDSSLEINGVHFHGTPMLVSMDDGEMSMHEHYDLIPQDVDILITHRPPLGILDGPDGFHIGSAQLLEKIKTIRPQLHLFGHDHDSYGMVQYSGTLFSNAALCDHSYRIVRPPQIITFNPI